ncbi:MAG: ATP-binding protein [Desulfovibrio sp.]|jgi:hypothetical protein|nr:ATP-binding protein [Desulfovibrio sp.]
MHSLPPLSIGEQSFSELRKSGFLYVDKTKYLVDLIDGGSAYFLSRPRRFGKTLTVSTLESIFKGETQLFNGLYAERWLKRSDFSAFPVIPLSFGSVSAAIGIDKMRTQLKTRLLAIAKDNNLSLHETDPSEMFFQLVNKMKLKYNKNVVILVDEYDHPMLEFINDKEKATDIRAEIQDFLSVIKGTYRDIEFTFITGITNFRNQGLNLVLDNLNDITLDKNYAAICGYTQEELDKYFCRYIESLGKKKSLCDEVINNRIVELYDGFSFDGDTHVYNPLTINSLFKKQRFANYWFGTATPTYIENYLLDKAKSPCDYIEYDVPYDVITSPQEIEDVSPAILLCQSGYLTLRTADDSDIFSIVYPNNEVANSILRLASNNLFKSADNIAAKKKSFVDFFSKGDVANIIREFNDLLSQDIYDSYAMMTGEPVNHACYNRDILSTFICSTSWIDVSKEVYGSHGRTDILAKLRLNGTEKIYVFELKMLKDGSTPEVTLAEAKSQIIRRKYTEAIFLYDRCCHSGLDCHRQGVTNHSAL